MSFRPPTPPALPKFAPDARLFFLYGGDLGRLSAARRELLRRLVPPEERDANLVEIEPPANRQLTLEQIGPTIMEELGTSGFFPDQRRVIVVTGLADLFGGPGGAGSGARGGRRKGAAGSPAKGAKYARSPRKGASAGAGAGAGDDGPPPPPESPSERMAAYLRGAFQAERNVLVVVADEDEEKQRKVRDDDPLVAHLLARAVTLSFREPPLRFEFEQALYDRDAARAVAIYRQWIAPDTRAGVFAAISHVVRVMLQVRVRDTRPELRGAAGGGSADDPMLRAKLEEFFPKGRSSISSIHPFALKKAEQGARRYSLGELVAAHAALLTLNDAFFPPRGALFVPDLDVTVEHYLLRLCARA